ncbi:MAG: pyridoxamine 5'-phosphate oxidase family protein [Coriobacteriales bacterium]|jgi:uncharacterized pyridoxamine 5'-phosphate oxidase family protein
MSQIGDYLKKGTYFLATVDGDQPRVRPVGAVYDGPDGRAHIGIGSFKNVYKQLKANPKCEIVACDGGEWLRYTGTAVFDDTDEYSEAILDAIPFLREHVYNEETGFKMETFHLENATAQIIDMMTVVEELDV